jgi:hypothetical protein
MDRGGFLTTLGRTRRGGVVCKGSFISGIGRGRCEVVVSLLWGLISVTREAGDVAAFRSQVKIFPAQEDHRNVNGQTHILGVDSRKERPWSMN